MKRVNKIGAVGAILLSVISLGAMELVISHNKGKCTLPPELQQEICSQKGALYLHLLKPQMGIVLYDPTSYHYLKNGTIPQKQQNYCFESMTLHVLKPNNVTSIDQVLKIKHISCEGKSFHCITKIVENPDCLLFDQRSRVHTTGDVSIYLRGQIIAGNYNNKWYIRSLLEQQQVFNSTVLSHRTYARTKEIKNVKDVTCIALHQHLQRFIYCASRYDNTYYTHIVDMIPNILVIKSTTMHTPVAQQKAPVNFKIIYPLTDRLYIGLGVDGNVYSLFHEENTIEYNKKNITYYDCFQDKHIADYFDQLAVDTYENSKQMILVNKKGMPFYLNIKKPFSDNKITLHKIGNAQTMCGRIWFFKDQIGELLTTPHKDIKTDKPVNNRLRIDYKMYNVNYFIIRPWNASEKAVFILKHVEKGFSAVFKIIKNTFTEQLLYQQ